MFGLFGFKATHKILKIQANTFFAFFKIIENHKKQTILIFRNFKLYPILIIQQYTKFKNAKNMIIEFKFSICSDTKYEINKRYFQTFENISEYLRIFLRNIHLYLTMFTLQ